VKTPTRPEQGACLCVRAYLARTPPPHHMHTLIYRTSTFIMCLYHTVQHTPHSTHVHVARCCISHVHTHHMDTTLAHHVCAHIPSAHITHRHLPGLPTSHSLQEGFGFFSFPTAAGLGPSKPSSGCVLSAHLSLPVELSTPLEPPPCLLLGCPPPALHCPLHGRPLPPGVESTSSNPMSSLSSSGYTPGLWGCSLCCGHPLHAGP
jgi:hypothetical protein